MKYLPFGPAKNMKDSNAALEKVLTKVNQLGQHLIFTEISFDVSSTNA